MRWAALPAFLLALAACGPDSVECDRAPPVVECSDDECLCSQAKNFCDTNEGQSCCVQFTDDKSVAAFVGVCTGGKCDGRCVCDPAIFDDFVCICDPQTCESLK